MRFFYLIILISLIGCIRPREVMWSGEDYFSSSDPISEDDSIFNTEFDRELGRETVDTIGLNLHYEDSIYIDFSYSNKANRIQIFQGEKLKKVIDIKPDLSGRLRESSKRVVLV